MLGVDASPSPEIQRLPKEPGMSDFPDTTTWAITEFADADLGDLRRTQRVVQLAHALAQEYRKNKAPFHASPPPGVSSHLVRVPPGSAPHKATVAGDRAREVCRVPPCVSRGTAAWPGSRDRV